MARKKAPRTVKEYIDRKNPELCKLVDACLNEISKPERLEDAPINQVASIMFSVIDRFGELSDGSNYENLIKLIEGLKEK